MDQNTNADDLPKMLPIRMNQINQISFKEPGQDDPRVGPPGTTSGTPEVTSSPETHIWGSNRDSSGALRSKEIANVVQSLRAHKPSGKLSPYTVSFGSRNAALSWDSHGWMMEEHRRQMNAATAPVEPEASSALESQVEGPYATNEKSPELTPTHSQTTQIDNTIVVLGEEIRGQLVGASGESTVSEYANVDKPSKAKKVRKARRRDKAKS